MNNREKVTEVCREYCTGCGLCGAVINKKFSEDEKYYPVPDLNPEDRAFCEKICPAAGNYINNYSDGTIWGKINHSYLGWAADETVRHRASSGGVLTAICSYLIEEKAVDGIIQVKKDGKDPRKTVTVVSTTLEAVEDCAGSRYTTSSPLLNITALMEPGKTYAFVGKPCDVSALRMLQKTGNESWTNQIKYMFSFFCAGQPSLAANNRLLSALNCNAPSECKELSYRGNGWPGKATVELENGQRYEMDYEKSWMTILGRDVRRCCRFCADGTGETADISCGDAWYLTPDNKPDFEEKPGRNVVFCRTEAGDQILEAAKNSGKLIVQDYDVNKDGLKLIQPYHFNRKASMSSLKAALTICGRSFPLYDDRKLRQFAKGYPLKNKLLRFAGAIKRVWSKAI